MSGASVTVHVEWCMGHRLPNHMGKCFNLHGHQYAVEAIVLGQINDERGAPDEGMVVDFGHIKASLKDIVSHLDHTMLLSIDDPLLPVMRAMPGVREVPYVPTAENIARDILHQLPPHVVRVRIWETPTSFAEVWR